MSNGVTFSLFFIGATLYVKNLILIANLLIIKGDEESGKRKGLFQVPSFSDPLGARTQDLNIKSVVLYLLS